MRVWATLGFTAAVAGAFILVQSMVVVAWVIIGAASGRLVALRSLETNGLLLARATCVSAPVAIGLTWFFARMRREIRVADYLALRPVSPKAVLQWATAMSA